MIGIARHTTSGRFEYSVALATTYACMHVLLPDFRIQKRYLLLLVQLSTHGCIRGGVDTFTPNLHIDPDVVCPRLLWSWH
jgi:hypothetical protein